ncbi:Mur ligase [Ophiobolus disseminans]|uniref:Mur ligase n=1 Tax=Ophiobolus disseminans TaxID=1469910 RepID=A0A6A7ALZ1_9PLEO|nr:Mur ligase [Ophiobolus disseminans]
MIQPGLERIGLLLKDVTFPWKAIHVAGTNGKGSICHYAATLLRRRSIRIGHFTSPHLINRWDGIAINDKAVDEVAFKRVEKHFTDMSLRENINASSFEILTATAFTMFNKANIDIGVVEVGMGGTLDATNILNNQAISVIAKIAKDHEGFLGNTLTEIARHKAGILRPNVPYIVNPMNEWNVHDVIDEYAKEIGAGPRLVGDTPKLRENLYSLPDWRRFAQDLRPFQRDNAVLAIIAVKEALKSADKQTIRDDTIVDELNKKRIQKPGRFQFMHVQPVFKSPDDLGRFIIVDGAHNPDAASALHDFMYKERYRERHRRKQLERELAPREGWPVTWVLAMTEGKDAWKYLSAILKPGDTVITTSFGPVDGMPWVKSMDPSALLQTALSAQEGITGFAMPLPGAVRAVCAAKYLTSIHSQIVLTGSLYFVGDLHRELQGRNRYDYWKLKRNIQDQKTFMKMHREERERAERFLSGRDIDLSDRQDTSTPLEAAGGSEASSVMQKNVKIQAEIEALEKEMDLLTVQELELLNSDRSSSEASTQDQAEEGTSTTPQEAGENQHTGSQSSNRYMNAPDSAGDPFPTSVDEPSPFEQEFKKLAGRRREPQVEGEERGILSLPGERMKGDHPRNRNPNVHPQSAGTMNRRPTFLLEKKKRESL